MVKTVEEEVPDCWELTGRVVLKGEEGRVELRALSRSSSSASCQRWKSILVSRPDSTQKKIISIGIEEK